jgi:hypothetical protein
VDILPFLETVRCHPDFQLSVTMKDMGNPFMEETGDLFTLNTKKIAHPSVAEMVASQYDDGKTRFNEFF